MSGDATYCTLDEIVQSGSTAGAVYGGVLIGKPLPGVHLSVVGPDLLPVPVGQPGELLVGGVGVALGYHCRPQEAATRFLRSAVRNCDRELDSGVYIPGLEPGRRVFRTGDRVVQSMAGGPFFWLGKLDGEVCCYVSVGWEVYRAPTVAQSRFYCHMQANVGDAMATARRGRWKQGFSWVGSPLAGLTRPNP